MRTWISISDVEMETGLTHKKIREFCEIGSLPCRITTGGHRRFKWKDVERFKAIYEQYETLKGLLYTPAVWADKSDM